MTDYDGTHDAICNAEDTLELCGERAFCLEVNENIVAFVLVVDGVCKSSLAPLADFTESAVGSDKACELFNESLDCLLGKLCIDDEQGFV